MNKRKGFSLVEMLFVITFFGLIMGLMGYFLVDMMRVTNVANNGFDMQRQGRHELDVMMSDIRDSSLVLSDAPAETTALSDNSKCIILQSPSYDSAGNSLGINDIIAYQLVGSAAPYELQRTIWPAVGSSRPAVSGAVVAKNVKSMTLTYFSDQGVIGDGITKVFTLAGIPTNANLTVTENGSVLQMGSSPGQYTFTAPQTLTFVTAPSAPDSIDTLYIADPAVSPSQVTSVDVDLQLQVTSPALGRTAPTQTFELTGRCRLRNHGI